MKHLSQTLRIGLALFLAIFGTSALPTAAASALEGDQAATETQTVQAEPVAEATPTIVEATPPPPEQETLPAPLPSEEFIIEEEPAVAPVTGQEPDIVQDLKTAPTALLQVDNTAPGSQSVVVVDQTCDDITTPGSNGWTTKFNDGYPDTVGYTAPSGFLVDKYCVKAGSTQQGNGPLIVDVIPPASSVTIDYPEKDSISHYVVHLIPGQTIVSTVAPIVVDECDYEQDSITLPDDTSQITYARTGNVVTATLVNPSTHDFGGTLNGFVVAEGGLTASYTVTFGEEECEEECPVVPESSILSSIQVADEEDCVKKVWVCKYVGIPGINETLKQGNDGLVQVSVNAIQQNQWDGTLPGWFSDAQDRSYVIAFVDDKKDPPSAADCPQPEQPEETTPVEPTLKDICYLDKDGIFIGYTEGVRYKVNGEKAKGWVPFTGTTLNVTAEPKEGYAFPEGAVTLWTYTSESFTDEQCLTITKTAKVASDTNLDGLIGVGDTVTWTITVTNTSEQDCENFYVTVEDPNTVLEDDGYIGFLGAGESKTLTATSTITANDLEACKLVNTATFSGWRALAYDRGELSFTTSNLVVEMPDPLATGSASATYNLVCPETGQVLGDTTVTPAPVVAPAPQVLPATIPATGQSESNFGIVLGIVLSALTYFAMLRRYQEV
jgi:LPXTG-motif cell wall-anchored protein